jgi:flagellar hook-associated protein 1 FlgK
MSGVLNIATRSLMANQAILQTTGHNIANVNTAGYSRQSAVLQTVEGQFTGGGYIGKGVDVQTIVRNYSEFLTRQATLAGATSAGDTARSDKLRLLEEIFPGGSSALGAALSDMLNSFSDVANAPTDLTARAVALTRVSETASRMRRASQSLDDLQLGVTQELDQKITAANTLAQSIASINERISQTLGSGQSPNDLLDQRDQLVRELNRYVQTTSINNSDGSVGVFIGGSQALVLGNSASPISLRSDDFNDPLKSKLLINRNGQQQLVDEVSLAGGEISGLLRFQNSDLNEARNLLGRITLGVSTAMNAQHRLGVDLDGNVGGNLFTPTSFTTNNIMPPSAPAILNTGTAAMALSIADSSKLASSDYEMNFSGGTTGTITRRSDGVLTAFDFASTNPLVLDGFNFSLSSGTANAGDRFLIKPFSTSASNIQAEFSTPRSLAVSSPLAGQMGTTNTGSLQQSRLTARSNPPTNLPVTLNFTGSGTYTRSDVAGTFNYTSGQSIEGTVPATAPLSQWSLILHGAPKAGDTYTVSAQPNAYRNLNSGNALAIMDLRDVAMFDGAVLTDGYASMISQIGIRAQSANYATQVSSSIAANLETDRTAISGVNLDEEASKLLQFQQAYQASAKLIQVSQSIFDTLIQTMAR